jgi:predicted nucleic acid-binding protein
LSAFIDTSIIVRHLTGDPPAMAPRATRFLAAESGLLVADVIVAETVYVLESFYEAPRDQVVEAIRSMIASSRSCALTLRSCFARSRCIDEAIDRVETVERVEPPA